MLDLLSLSRPDDGNLHRRRLVLRTVFFGMICPFENARRKVLSAEMRCVGTSAESELLRSVVAKRLEESPAYS
jgi:hypothetical protein